MARASSGSGAPDRGPTTETTLGLTGDYSERVHHDTTFDRIYFARSGHKVPQRAEFVVGALVGVVGLVLWAISFVVALILQSAVDGFNGTVIGLVIPALLLVLAMLVMPFVRRWTSTEAKLVRGLRSGELVEVRRGPLAERLMAAAAANRPGYFEQAEELARADLLLAQADQLDELATSASVAGSHAPGFAQEAEVLERRLRAAEADRRSTVASYLGVTDG